MKRSTVMLVLLLAPVVTSVPTAAAESLLTDARDDVQVVLDPGAAPQAVPLPSSPAWNAADLVALDLEETHEHLTFHLTVADLTSPVVFGAYAMRFTFNDVPYSVDVFVTSSAGTGRFSQAELSTTDEDDRYNDIADLDHDVDEESGMIMVTVPKVYLVDFDGRVPVQDSTLENIHVMSSVRFFAPRFRATLHDMMPDDGVASFTFTIGPLSAGHLTLNAPDPVRVSNGQATTFMFEVFVSNEGDRPDDVDVALVNLPTEWSGRVETPITVPAGETRRLPVLVSVPFKHEHGGFDPFNITVKSGRDPQAFATARLGVAHTPLPFPAGHHPDLFLHTRNEDAGVFNDVFRFTSAFMSTDGDHTNDDPEAALDYVGGEGFGWLIPLAPVLAIGLDFNVDELGTIAGSIMGRHAGEGTMRGELWLVEGDDDIQLLGTTEKATLTVDLTTATPFELTLTPTPEADYIPYERGRNVELRLYFSAPDNAGMFVCCFSQTSPTLMVADFKMSLPLNEYHDRIVLKDVAGVAKSRVKLVADGPLEREARPATTLTYPFTLTNAGSDAEMFVVDVAGTDAERARVAPRGEIPLGPGESVAITLAVRLPDQANDGEAFEAIVLARSQRDPGDLALGRTKTVISLAAETQDEEALIAAAEDAQRDTPAPSVALVAVAVAVALGLVGRRRG